MNKMALLNCTYKKAMFEKNLFHYYYLTNECLGTIEG